MLTALSRLPGVWTRVATAGAFVVFLTAAGCDSTTADRESGAAPEMAGLQSSGSIAYLSTVVEAPPSDPTAGQREWVELSAPLLPDWDKLYEGLPSTLEGERALAESATFTFTQLLTECAEAYPAITLMPRTTAELAANYDAVARCAYETRSSKPYWIPKLLADVDVCRMKLGAGWRLLSEDDLGTFTPDAYRFLRDTLAPSADGAPWAVNYFGLDVWVRTDEGSIGIATLDPEVTGNRVAQRDLGDEATALQRPVALRCIRRTDAE
jgi:hypothetical protein